MRYRLEERALNKQRITSQVSLFTVHDHPHTLDEYVDDLENLSCRSLSLCLSEPVQPLQDRIHVLLSEGFLHEFDCAMLRKV